MDKILSIVEISRAEAREDARNNRNLFIGLTGLLLAVIAILSAFGPQMFEAGMHGVIPSPSYPTFTPNAVSY